MKKNYPYFILKRTFDLLLCLLLIPLLILLTIMIFFLNGWHKQFLSGEQKQRVALARAIAKRPEIILLDEPFSHIDNFKKQSLRRNLFAYLKTNNIACIMATHDKDDVLSFADQMMVLHKGVVMRTGLYHGWKSSLKRIFCGN